LIHLADLCIEARRTSSENQLIEDANLVQADDLAVQNRIRYSKFAQVLRIRGLKLLLETFSRRETSRDLSSEKYAIAQRNVWESLN
jgi:hypothetical protein